MTTFTCDSIDYDRITRIYVGQDEDCRCGYHGTYAERGTHLFDRRLKTLRRRVDNCEFKDIGVFETRLEVSYGKNRTITVYYD